MQRRRLATRHGFTLIELMIVVAIMGILATIAIPTFRSYVYKSKTSEATTFLGEIRQRQESYRAEFGGYADVSGAALTAYTPSTVPGGSAVSWPSGDGWRQLGAAPDGQVYFQYLTGAGLPGTTPPAEIEGYDGSDFWFVSRAQADLDGDGTTVLFEAYSAGPGIYVDKVQGWE